MDHSGFENRNSDLVQENKKKTRPNSSQPKQLKQENIENFDEDEEYVVNNYLDEPGPQYIGADNYMVQYEAEGPNSKNRLNYADQNQMNLHQTLSSRPLSAQGNQNVVHGIQGNNIKPSKLFQINSTNTKAKHILHDKERLYEDIFVLRNKINALTKDNSILKAKLISAESQITKYKKMYEDKINESNAPYEYSKVGMKHETGLTLALKKQVKDLLFQNQEKEKELLNIKKSVKYSKMNELEIQSKTLTDEYAKVLKLYENLAIEHKTMLKDVEIAKDQIQMQQHYVDKLTKENSEYQQTYEFLSSEKARSDRILFDNVEKIKKLEDINVIQKKQLRSREKDLQRLRNELARYVRGEDISTKKPFEYGTENIHSDQQNYVDKAHQNTKGIGQHKNSDPWKIQGSLQQKENLKTEENHKNSNNTHKNEHNGSKNTNEPAQKQINFGFISNPSKNATSSELNQPMSKNEQSTKNIVQDDNLKKKKKSGTDLQSESKKSLKDQKHSENECEKVPPVKIEHLKNERDFLFYSLSLNKLSPSNFLKTFKAKISLNYNFLERLFTAKPSMLADKESRTKLIRFLLQTKAERNASVVLFSPDKTVSTSVIEENLNELLNPKYTNISDILLNKEVCTNMLVETVILINKNKEAINSQLIHQTYTIKELKNIFKNANLNLTKKQFCALIKEVLFISVFYDGIISSFPLKIQQKALRSIIFSESSKNSNDEDEEEYMQFSDDHKENRKSSSYSAGEEFYQENDDNDNSDFEKKAEEFVQESHSNSQGKRFRPESSHGRPQSSKKTSENPRELHQPTSAKGSITKYDEEKNKLNKIEGALNSSGSSASKNKNKKMVQENEKKAEKKNNLKNKNQENEIDDDLLNDTQKSKDELQEIDDYDLNEFD